jgi:hypothetical protein
MQSLWNGKPRQLRRDDFAAGQLRMNIRSGCSRLGISNTIRHHGLPAIAVLAAAAAGLSGCGGVGSVIQVTQGEPVAVLFVNTPPSTMAVNASTTLYAVTQYSSAGASENSAVTYSISCGSANACGTLGPSDEVGADSYTAPAAVPSGGTVTVTATSVTDTSLSRSVTIAIVPPIPISVSLAGPLPASLQVNSTVSLVARVANDVTANPQIQWSATCGASNCGSFNPTTTDNDSVTQYTAPAAIPPGGSVTLTATSVTDPTKSASGSIVITAAAPNLANGTYVFQVDEPNLAEYVTGVLTAQNGTITGGEQDAVYEGGDDGDYSYTQPFSSGSYSTTPSGNVAITINLLADETETLSGTLASGQQGFISGIDGTLGTGTLELQTSTTAPAGGYAFSLDASNYYDGQPWMTGIVNVDSPGGISGNGSELDVEEEGFSGGGTQTVGASTVSAPDAYGRVLFQLNLSGNAYLPVLYVAGYIVDASHLRLINVGIADDSFVVTGPMAGVALGQGANTGKFSAASVAGTSYVFGAEGEDQQGSLQLAGAVTLNAGGTVTGTLNWNDLSRSSPQSPLALTGTYAVDPTGRVALTNLTDGTTFTYSMHLDLDGNGGGLVLSDDAEDVFSGEAFQQQTGTFSAASLSGSYGLNTSLYSVASNEVPGFGNAVGLLLAAPGSGADDVAGFADANGGQADFAVSGSFTPAANGVFPGTLTGFNPAAATTADTFTVYMVDNTQGLAIETDNAQLTLMRLALAP